MPQRGFTEADSHGWRSVLRDQVSAVWTEAAVDVQTSTTERSVGMRRDWHMGTWGPGVFENDAASDWLGHLDKLGFFAIATPLAIIGEYFDRKKYIPADAEQSFWAMCEVVGIAGGLTDPSQAADYSAAIKRDAEKILKLPNLKWRILCALDRLESETTELEELWDSAGEGEIFRSHRDRAKDAALKVLRQDE